MSSYIKVGQENSTPIEVYCDDHVAGSLAVLIHGWPPSDASSRRQTKMIKNVGFVEVTGGPHGVLWTRAEQINSELVKLLA
jgi:pimeloyl-ACP methyl ester carboxylesterase